VFKPGSGLLAGERSPNEKELFNRISPIGQCSKENDRGLKVWGMSLEIRIEFSSAGIGAVVMLPPEQSFNRDFFVGNVSPKIIDDRALGCPTLKGRGTFLHFDNMRP
jgi:hypothetical protein